MKQRKQQTKLRLKKLSTNHRSRYLTILMKISSKKKATSKNDTEVVAPANKTIIEKIKLKFDIEWLTITPLSNDVKTSIKKK